MRLVLTILLIAFGSLCAAEKPQTITRTFYVTGVECGSCVYVVQQSVSETKGVSEVTLVQVVDNYANVTFDPQVVGEHQIAQAVREALPIHGMPYLASLRVKMPNYTKQKAQVDALFAGWKSSVTLVPSLDIKDEFAIHFEELKADAKKLGPQGWNFTQFAEAAEGLGVEFKLVLEGQ